MCKPTLGLQAANEVKYCYLAYTQKINFKKYLTLYIIFYKWKY